MLQIGQQSVKHAANRLRRFPKVESSRVEFPITCECYSLNSNDEECHATATSKPDHQAVQHTNVCIKTLLNMILHYYQLLFRLRVCTTNAVLLGIWKFLFQCASDNIEFVPTQPWTTLPPCLRFTICAGINQFWRQGDAYEPFDWMNQFERFILFTEGVICCAREKAPVCGTQVSLALLLQAQGSQCVHYCRKRRIEAKRVMAMA